MKKPPQQFIDAGLALKNGQIDKAIKLLDRLVNTDPLNLSYRMKRGEAYFRKEDFQTGLQDFAKAVELDHKNIQAVINFGAALIRCNQPLEAKEILDYALELDPNSFDAYVNLCNVFQFLHKPDEALRSAMRAIEIRPDHFLAFNNLGTALGDLNLIDESREAFQTAHELNPHYLPSIINLAQLHVKQANFDQAQKLYEDALTSKKITPFEADLVRYYLSYLYLQKGILAKGWDYYDFGFGPLLPVTALRSLRKFMQPRWDGKIDLTKRLLVWREQGLGDEIEFSTCFPDLVATGMNITIECDRRLVSIFERNYPSLSFRPESVGPDQLPRYDDFDVQIPIGSLPRIYRREKASFEAHQTQWSVDGKFSDVFHQRLEPYKNKTLVGICWRSGLLRIQRNESYSGLPDWKLLLQRPDIQVVNLQYGDCESELAAIEQELGISVLRWPDIDLKNDLEAVIALIDQLDTVVTVGTAVSSLAGAVGKKCLLLAKRSWVFLGETDRYPWYPNVRPLIVQDHELVAARIPDAAAMI
jgi:tetratricopeptide (TPR) repeat protein